MKNKLRVVAIDFGIKKNILRYFSDYDCEVKVVSCNLSSKKILELKPHGVFLSNGPGDPAATGKYAIPVIRDLIKKYSYFWYLFRTSAARISIKCKNKKK